MENLQARLEIAGLDEIIKDEVYKAVQLAVKEVIGPVLREFKAEMVVTANDELLKEPNWTKKEIMRYTKKKEGWIYNLSKKYPDFPKKLNSSDNERAIWDRDELLKFFARHPEISVSKRAKKDLEMIRREK